MNSDLMEKIVALAKRRGFIYPGSDIYGGVANTYDYGPVGAELLRNIRELWWKEFVQKREDMLGLDASLISHQKVWQASGHVSGFADAQVDCKNCKHRMRADHLIEDYLEVLDDKELLKITKSLKSSEKIKKAVGNKKVEGLGLDELGEIITSLKIHCPKCGKSNWTKVRKFNLLFPVHLGIVEGDQDIAYLRGETAQGMFINFKNVLNSTRVKLPFGIAQLGKSFRNEITLGNSVFRTLEFELAEIEYFFNPKQNKWEDLFNNWKKDMEEFVIKKLLINKKNLRWRTHTDEERSFYSKKTEDLDYRFPFGFKELWGLAYRTDYDLKKHHEYSGKDLTVTDPETGKSFIPHVIEPAVGINRFFLMILCDSYAEEEDRVILKIDPKLAPYKVAVFPLLANKPELVKLARKVFKDLKADYMVYWDDRGNIGKRYFAQDEIGTPFCITVDFQSLEDKAVTLRDRDTMKQERVKINDLTSCIQKKLL
ncbi:MAG: glycine--tRNA ligase [Candidatus Levyibacteriota bacterium]